MDLFFDGESQTYQTIFESIRNTIYISSITIVVRMKDLKDLQQLLMGVCKLVCDRPLIDLNIYPKMDEESCVGRFDIGAVGGTFDYLHIGHKLLLLYSVLVTKKELIVGISGKQLLGKKQNKEVMQDYLVRQGNVVNFIHKINPQLIVKVAELSDGYGPTIVRGDVQGLILSQQTISGGQAINQIRKERHMHQLQIVVCQAIGQNVQVDNKFKGKISSSSIRQYILTKNGMNGEGLGKYRMHWDIMIKGLHNLTNIPSINNNVATKWWNTILVSYSQYWRYYHTNYHILTLINDLYALPTDKSISLTEQSMNILLVAIFFHDLVYNPTSKDNQKQSAQLCKQFLKELLEESLINQQAVKQYQTIKYKSVEVILSTIHHQSNDPICIIMNYVDMKILGEQLPIYQIYAKQIEQQYTPSVGANYNHKRVQFLKSVDITKLDQRINQERVVSNMDWQVAHLQ